jgi:hypothetical protein
MGSGVRAKDRFEVAAPCHLERLIRSRDDWAVAPKSRAKRRKNPDLLRRYRRRVARTYPVAPAIERRLLTGLGSAVSGVFDPNAENFSVCGPAGARARN